MIEFVLVFGLLFVRAECSLRQLDGKLPMLNGKGMPLVVDVDVAGFNQQMQDIISKDLVGEIKGTLANFTSSNEFKDLVQKELKREIDELSKTTNEKIKALETKTQTLKSFIDQGKELIPAFGVSLTESKTLAPNEVLKFNKVWTNIGNGYNTNTGVFTAPRSGVYHVSCTAFTSDDKTLRLFLMRNDDVIVVLYPGNKGHSSGTINMVLQLKAGDTLYMQHPNLSYDNDVLTNINGFVMFSGYFISE